MVAKKQTEPVDDQKLEAGAQAPVEASEELTDNQKLEALSAELAALHAREVKIKAEMAVLTEKLYRERPQATAADYKTSASNVTSALREAGLLQRSSGRRRTR